MSISNEECGNCKSTEAALRTGYTGHVDFSHSGPCRNFREGDVIESDEDEDPGLPIKCMIVEHGGMEMTAKEAVDMIRQGSGEDLKEDLQLALGAMIDAANSVIPEFAEAHKGDKVNLAGALKTLREALKMMKEADAVLESALIEAGVEYGGENLTGVGMTHIHRAGKKTIYDNPMVISKFSAVLHKQINTPTTDGEILSREEAMDKAISTMAKLVGATTKSFSSWRKTEAKKLGIDLNDYATEEGGRLSVRFE